MTFGGWSIDAELFEWIRARLPEGKTVLELGSGNSTKELVKHWDVFSVEESPQWVNVYHSQYIYAPIFDGWYDESILKERIPSTYDLLLVDGPAHGTRGKMNDHLAELKFFSSGCTLVVFDDVDRVADRLCYQKFLDILQENNLVFETEITKTSSSKAFAWVSIVSAGKENNNE